MKSGLPPILAVLLGSALVLPAHAALVIKPQPAALTVNAGSTASFSVDTTNAGPVTCQWQFNGTNLLGQTNLSLIIEDVSLTQAGPYRALVSGPGWAATSSPATLKVLQGTIVRFALATGNVDVELFDHDKPVTVQNFLHYYNYGVYQNTFFHRLVPNFVLQGGGFGTTNRSASPLVISNIVDLFNFAYDSYNSYFISIKNEFANGPLVHNTFGTLAMARVSGQVDSATSQWFFNLADNSTNLDNVDGGFTVFGRTLRGAEVLSGFNSLSTNSGITNLSSYWPAATNSGAFWPSQGSIFSDVPIQSGTNFPANSSLFFANIKLQSKPVLDLTRPSMKITYPTPDAYLSNGTFTISGTAQDNLGVSLVDCWIYGHTPGLIDTLKPCPVTGLSNWTTSVTNLVPGIYILESRVWDGYGNGNWATNIFHITTPLTVVTNGLGKIAPDLNGKWLAPFVDYKLTATPNAGMLFAGWSGSGVNSSNPKLTFNVTKGLVLTASFASNYFPNLVATYSGLFYPTNSTNAIASTNSGSFSLTTTGTGGYNGYMLVADKRITLGGTFNYAGQSQISVTIPKSTNIITLALTLDLTNDTGIISGTVTGKGWTSDLLGYRGVKKVAAPLAAAKYVISLPADLASSNEPAGDGYAIATVAPAGTVSVVGRLADNAAFSSGATVAKGGQWPLYGSLYGGKGVLIGWQNLTNASAPVNWVRPPSVAGAYGAFSATVSSIGSLFNLPAAPTDYQLTLDNGPLDQPVSGTVTINSAGQCTLSGALATQLKVSLSKTTALITGKYTPAAGLPLTLSGAFQSPISGGAGFFTNSTGLSGHLTIH